MEKTKSISEDTLNKIQQMQQELDQLIRKIGEEKDPDQKRKMSVRVDTLHRKIAHLKSLSK